MGAQTVSPRQLVPLVLTISKGGVGGIAGLSPTVQLRRTSDGFFLDWSDDTFKNSGWTTLDGPLTDLGGGQYQRVADLGAIGAVNTDTLVALYVNTASGSRGASNDVLHVEDMELLRQMVSNRIEESPGSPGQLVLYDEDDLTPRKTWELRDYLGGSTLPSVGAPSRRSAAT